MCSSLLAGMALRWYHSVWHYEGHGMSRIALQGVHEELGYQWAGLS